MCAKKKKQPFDYSKNKEMTKFCQYGGLLKTLLMENGIHSEKHSQFTAKGTKVLAKWKAPLSPPIRGKKIYGVCLDSSLLIWAGVRPPPAPPPKGG